MPRESGKGFFTHELAGYRDRMLHQLLEGLRSRDEESRMVAAAEIGDLLARGVLTDSEHLAAVNVLIDIACHESADQPREAVLNSIVVASSRRPSSEVTWRKIEDLLSRLNGISLEYAIVALGYSGRKEYVARLQTYLNDADDVVRQAAADAVTELNSQE